MSNKYDSIASFAGQKRSGNETRVLDGILHVYYRKCGFIDFLSRIQHTCTL